MGTIQRQYEVDFVRALSGSNERFKAQSAESAAKVQTAANDTALVESADTEELVQKKTKPPPKLLRL